MEESAMLSIKYEFTELTDWSAVKGQQHFVTN